MPVSSGWSGIPVEEPEKSNSQPLTGEQLLSLPESSLLTTASSRLQVDLTMMQFIGGGGNSRIYRIGGRSKQWALKEYFHHKNDLRDRLGVEFSSLTFLAGHGVTNVPKPVLMDREGGFAIYEFIEGARVDPMKATVEQIADVTGFLGKLAELAKEDNAKVLPDASEACFSGMQIVETVDGRLRRLHEVAGEHPMLEDFLEGEAKPAFAKMKQWSCAGFENHELSWMDATPWTTLSQSDFGFHNALLGSNGLIYVDFEYFGWDDPAKMACDFLFHPGTAVTSELKQAFIRGVLSTFSEYPKLETRIALIYPLIGMNWCLRVLNEFLKEFQMRREFARAHVAGAEVARKRQLVKARNMLNSLIAEYESFPYASQ